MPSQHFARILVLRFGRIGDLLVLTPALRALREAFPTATIELLTTPIGAATLSTNPNIDTIHSLHWRRLPWQLNPEKARLVRRLGKREFQVVFLFESARRYNALVDRLDVPNVYSFTRPGEAEGRYRVTVRPEAHWAQNCDRVLKLAGVPSAGWHYDFPLSAQARRRAEALLAKYGIAETAALVGIHPAQFQRSRRWRRKPHPKAWPPERFAKVIGRLAERGAHRFLLTGSADEKKLAQSIARQLPPGLAVNIAGETDLQTLGAAITRCSLFISLDSGPAHIAAAVGTPLVALFGPKPPTGMGPLEDVRGIERIYLEPARLPADARDRYHPRMWAIQVEQVMEAVDRLGIVFNR